VSSILVTDLNPKCELAETSFNIILWVGSHPRKELGAMVVLFKELYVEFLLSSKGLPVDMAKGIAALIGAMTSEILALLGLS
jgi:hypothetical protein